MVQERRDDETPAAALGVAALEPLLRVEAEPARLPKPRYKKPRAVVPDSSYIALRKAQGESIYAVQHDKFREIEEMFDREHELWVPPRMRRVVRQIRTPIIEDVLRRVAAALTQGYPTFSQVPLTVGQSDQDRSEHLGEWLNAVFPLLEKQSGERAFFQAVWYAAMYGRGWLHLEWMPDAWENYEIWLDEVQVGPGESAQSFRNRIEQRKKLEKLPWYFRALHPRMVLPFRDHLGLKEVLIVEERPKLEIGDAYGKGDKGRLAPRLEAGPDGELWPVAPDELLSGLTSDETWRSINLGDTVEFVTYYNREWVAYWADGVLLKRVKHGYGRPPVFEARGLSTGSRDPAKDTRSIVDPLLELVRGLDQVLTIKLAWAYQAGLPMAFHKKAPRPAGTIAPTNQQGEAFQWDPARIMELQPGEEVGWIEAPGVGRDLAQIADTYERMIQEMSALPPIVRGFAEGANQPGYAINQLLNAAKMIFEPILDDLTTAFEQAADFLLWTIEHHVKEPVWLVGNDLSQKMRKRKTWLSLGPRDIQGYRLVRCSIKAVHPVADAAKMRAGLELWTAGAIPWDVFLSEYLGLPDAQQVIRKRKLEDLMKSPELMQLTTQEFIRALGMEGLFGEQQGTGPGGDPNALMQQMMGGMDPAMMGQMDPAMMGQMDPAMMQQMLGGQPPPVDAGVGGGLALPPAVPPQSQPPEQQPWNQPGGTPGLAPLPNSAFWPGGMDQLG